MNPTAIKRIISLIMRIYIVFIVTSIYSMIEEALKDLLNKLPNPSNYIINLGANTGPPSDPVCFLLKSGKYSGLCIEPVQKFIKELRDSYPSKNIQIVNDYATPENIVSLLNSSSTPRNPDIFKIDIDGYDLSVLRTVLENNIYKPSIIVAEINEKIPPPIYFELKYNPTFLWDESHYYGFSIQAGYKLLNQHGYVIIGIFDINNIIAVKGDLFPGIKQENIDVIYKQDFIDNPLRNNFYWNNNVEDWIEAKLENDIDYVHQKVYKYFTKMARRDKVVAEEEFILYIDS